MATYWMEDGSYSPELGADRRNLVERYNEIAGTPRPNEFASQEAFVAGKVSHEEAVSFVRLAEYVIDAIDSRFPDLKNPRLR